jgi:hypothetical protein
MASSKRPARTKRAALPHLDVPMRRLTILAQDPSVFKKRGQLLTTSVSIPAERLEPGPKGHRIHVIDYDASTNYYYRARDNRPERDHFKDVTSPSQLVGDPYFHQQNVYAITMATLYEFECALGRPVDWGFAQPGHQLKVAPHAFADANAYYSRESESLNFGYFPDDSGRRVYTCLSHDIIVHETTHALLDGLRSGYLSPSSPDQAGFHEGFADIVALLSVFRHDEVVQNALKPLRDDKNRISRPHLSFRSLANTALVKLGEEMGTALYGKDGGALRQSLRIRPNRQHYVSKRFEEEHDRGELLVAVVIRSFLKVWRKRLDPLLEDAPTGLNAKVVAEEGATAAKQLLRIAIRALDYMPPIDMSYGDYLSALLTADEQLYPDDSRYEYRKILKVTFAEYGISASSRPRGSGTWDPPPHTDFTLTGVHLERLQRDPTAAFRFVWENRDALGIEPSAFTRVTSVRPVIRVSNDQMVLQETVVEYVQTLKMYSGELGKVGIQRPRGMPGNRLVTLCGGGALIFGEFGQLKFHVGTGVRSRKQSKRLRYLWESGYFDAAPSAAARIATMHRSRAMGPMVRIPRRW